ncbi:MAG: phosphoenolpyruvate carboxykinase (ATP) [Candidatus Dadabacteria bacterium]|nr:MAG: phosphoenolpyruvate carboxykinase (ATP) [Candidatus Dadabacteria bacterium]
MGNQIGGGSKSIFKSTVVDRCLEGLEGVLSSHRNVLQNPSRSELVDIAISNREAITLKCGALATWTRPESTGRSPKDTYIVKHGSSAESVDWTSSYSNPLEPSLFDELWEDALNILREKERIIVTERVVGADPKFALPIRFVVDRALPGIFSYNMFRPVPEDIEESMFAGDAFVLFALPYDYVDGERYKGRLRDVNGRTSGLLVAMDMERKLGLIMGSHYQGSVKKTVFTVMNYLLPERGVLPLHCSANEGKDGKTALFLGLSGTGKTTISADPERALLGDDEFGWSDDGIANFENGCYAKLINLNPEKEPEIFHASFREADPHEHGALIENVMVYPDGSYDLNDSRLTENSRVSYPLTSLHNIKESARGGHPSHIIFLTADANGVLPPVAKLSKEQAMFWFLMGYTSKLAGTETGITDPVSTFSRFFGGPFMPRVPSDYIRLFGEKLEHHGTSVYLVNTGWTGGPYGVGKRFDILVTRNVVNGVLSGALDKAEYLEPDPYFHLSVPAECPGVDTALLDPRNTWKSQQEYAKRAEKLAADFAEAFSKSYGGGHIDPEVARYCPGR